MRDREIVLWVDERWYDALSRHLQDGTVEDKLKEYLDGLISQLPEQEYERISSEIYDEEQMEKQRQEKSRQLAVFHVKEHGEESYIQTDRGLEFLDTARMLRAYLRGECEAPSFSQTIYNAQEITAEHFQQMADLRMENTGQVTGAFELDFDGQTIAALNIMDGWKTYAMKDVSTAVYYADKKHYISNEDRWTRFLDRLDGKELVADIPEQEIPQMWQSM
ncbi:MAG: hypothetical protein NC319_05255 [Butyricicoccus sp.]|nr:hypothetical protein [Butyricicoccus sp.]